LKAEDIEEQVRAARVQQRWRRLDLVFAAIGAEIVSLFIIALALAVLCAPWAFGIGVTFGAGYWIANATGNLALGWIAGVMLFSFFCRYVWGSRLQAASRRAAESLISGK
jgi:hypothetical protein